MSLYMRVKRIEEADIPSIVDWFKDDRWPYPNSPKMLPKIGFCVIQNERVCASCYVYPTGTALGLISWLKADPQMDYHDQDSAMRTLLRHLQKELPFAGIKILQCVTPDPTIARLLREEAFKGGQSFDMKWLLKDESTDL